MAYYKKSLIVFILLFVIFSFFSCVRADTETLEASTASNLKISSNSNVFESVSGGSVSYVSMEVGYIYFITFSSQSSTSDRQVAISSSAPSLNGVYTYLGTLSNNSTFTYRPTEDSYFLCSYPANSNAVTFTREKVGSMDTTVLELASVVSPNAVWGIFNISIKYILIAVGVALGCYIIFKLIRRLSKGKSGNV